MKCPVCRDATLVMSDRQGIEIDYCPECRGVWLDRGELDKIVERSVAPAGQRNHGGGTPRPYPPGAGEYQHYKKKKRSGFLGELFDFD